MKTHSHSQNGQATIEYVLILFFSLWIFIVLIKGVLLPALNGLQNATEQKINTMGNNLHTLPFGH